MALEKLGKIVFTLGSGRLSMAAATSDTMIKMTFDKFAEFETDPWKKAMVQHGEAMQKSNVRKVIFVHGTFAGDDPLGVYLVMERLGVPSVITKRFKDISKEITNKNMDDLGNFPDDYITSFSDGIEHDIECKSFIWSSENNHIGRLLTIPTLAAYISEKAKGLSLDDRILLIGHSHAGQLFALLTVFLENDEKANALFNVLAEVNGFDKKIFSENIEKISNFYLDIVTLGTPVRYSWGEYGKYRLLNIVNHRSDSKIEGVLNTRDGDYVQQWGTDGTDLLPINLSLLECNDKLDSVLDKGRPIDIDTKLKEIKRRQPIKVNGEKVGETILVDYLDNGTKVIQFFGLTMGHPNFFETLFGHGVYTRRDSMLFNSSLVVDKFYYG